jgi:hypothetical protein
LLLLQGNGLWSGETSALFIYNRMMLRSFLFFLVLGKTISCTPKWSPPVGVELIDTTRRLLHCRKASCRIKINTFYENSKQK